METEIARLTAAVRRIGATITPTWDAEARAVVLTTSDVRAIVSAVRRVEFSSMEVREIIAFIGGPTPIIERRVSAHYLRLLLVSLGRMGDSIDRRKRIERGQFVGPMSGSEAMRFMMGRRGR